MKLTFRTHALRRMFERGIPAAAVRQVVEAADDRDVEPDESDSPPPEIRRPLCVVTARDDAVGQTIIVMVHEPNGPAEEDWP